MQISDYNRTNVKEQFSIQKTTGKTDGCTEEYYVVYTKNYFNELKKSLTERKGQQLTARLCTIAG